MHPILFHVGAIPVESHPVFIFLGVLAAGWIFFAEAERHDMLTPRLLAVVAITLAGGAVGARLGLIVRYAAETPDATMLDAIIRSGRSIVGGLAGAYVAAKLGKLALGYRLKTGDLFAPAVAAGMTIGRAGCLLAEPPGTPTSLPWGVRTAPGGVAMHPSFAYEILFQGTMFAVLWRLRHSARARGHLFEIYLLSYGLFRFLVEFVRGNPVLALGLTGSQLFIIPSALLLTGYFIRHRVGRSAHPAAA
jgi:prolipoprotein diacylglyceryltransferase